MLLLLNIPIIKYLLPLVIKFSNDSPISLFKKLSLISILNELKFKNPIGDWTFLFKKFFRWANSSCLITTDRQTLFLKVLSEVGSNSFEFKQFQKCLFH